MFSNKEQASFGLSELRGMNFNPEGNGTLLVLNANKNQSKVLKVTNLCSSQVQVTDVADDNGSLFTHPYDTEIHGNSFFLTSQDSNLVASFSMDCTTSSECVKSYKKVAELKEPRGIAFDSQGNLWVASADEKHIYI